MLVEPLSPASRDIGSGGSIIGDKLGESIKELVEQDRRDCVREAEESVFRHWFVFGFGFFLEFWIQSILNLFQYFMDTFHGLEQTCAKVHRVSPLVLVSAGLL